MDEPVRLSLLVGAWLVGWWLCGRVRRLDPVDLRPADPADRADRACISVVVPARDEATTLPSLLSGLAAQTLPPAEVIVVDDGSTDATASVARVHGARVLTAPPLPGGWTGKAWALWQGADAAREEVVLFLDADVEPSDVFVASIAHAFERDGGLVSVQPYHHMRRWWERAAAAFNLVAVMGTGLGSPSWPRRRPVRAAFGPVVICRRALFLEHGAEATVRRSVLEDVQLARSVAAAGEPVHLYAGGGVVGFRMYDRPIRLVEGFAKNFAAGARAVSLPRFALVIAWITATLVTGAWVFSAGVVAIALFVAFAAQVLVQLRQLGNFGVLSAVLYPVLVLVFVVVFAGSIVLGVRGEVRWKGRRISLRDP
jgi:4,4'-diaponeurosporenoate glycosyltransferase